MVGMPGGRANGARAIALGRCFPRGRASADQSVLDAANDRAVVLAAIA